MEQTKRNISVRLSNSDIKKMKEISGRLRVKESELFRYAIKNMLTKLMPLNDEKLRGADLIPAWLECGEELLNYFHIDTEQLNKIFNQNISGDEQRVDMEDLDLMVLSSLNQKYVVKKLAEICGMPVDPVDVQKILRTYLYEKYVLGNACTCADVTLSVPGSSNPAVVNAVAR